MFTIDTLVGHERMSTQNLLLAIGQAVAQGETEFEIHASGQHDIGGPLWHPEGKKLFFHVLMQVNVLVVCVLIIQKS